MTITSFTRSLMFAFTSIAVLCLTTVAQESDTKPKTEKTSNLGTSNLEAKSLEVAHPIKLNYLLSKPKNYEEQESWPLVLFLHGAGERGNNLELVKVHGPPKMVESGRDFPFILVAPQCPKNRRWEPISLSALLDDVETNYHVDKSRIYVTGLSMGGFGTWGLAAHSPERFAAIAPVCGGGDKFMAPFQIRNQIPIWVFHGAKDRVVPLSRSEVMVEALKKYKADVQFTVYPEAGHDSWTETYNNEKLYEWMLNQKRDSKSKISNSKNSEGDKKSESKKSKANNSQ